MILYKAIINDEVEELIHFDREVTLVVPSDAFSYFRSKGRILVGRLLY